MKNTLYKAIALLAAALLTGAVSPVASAENEEIHVVILATSDMHGNIWGFSYENNTETANNGMARLYSYIRQVREENPIVFLVDGGDAIQGTILTDDIANKVPDEPHPVIAAMNRMGYDAMTLGNHEFDWGMETMLKITGQGDFPVLAANALDREGKPVTGKGWTIIERGGVRLAVIGVVTPDVPVWDGKKEGVGNVTFEAGAAAVKRAVAEIGDQADIIMVSAHMGEYAEFDEDGGSDSAIRIIEENPGVNLLQVAHMHITVNNVISGIPSAGVRNAGREIVRMDVTLDRNHRITSAWASIVDMADYEPSDEIRELPIVKASHEAAIEYIRGGTGEGSGSGAPLGYASARFQPENEIRGLPEGRLRDTAVIDLILKVQLLNSGADVTSCSLFKDTSDLPAGEITYENIFDIYMYDNTLCRLPVTGRELKNYMEWAAESYNQWQPGDINISFDPEFPGYQHDLFGGVEYEIDLSKPKGERIVNVMFRGEPLRDDQILTLAVSNYRYASCLKPLNLTAGKRNWESSCSVRDMLVAYFADHSSVTPETDGNWRITGIDLSREDPRRKELIGWINEGKLPAPYNQSYNLSDYEKLAEEAAHCD